MPFNDVEDKLAFFEKTLKKMKDRKIMLHHLNKSAKDCTSFQLNRENATGDEQLGYSLRNVKFQIERPIGRQWNLIFNVIGRLKYDELLTFLPNILQQYFHL